jgi:hypothetical protein
MGLRGLVRAMSRNLDDYVDVATRVAQFYKQHPEGAIRSEVYFDDGKVVRVRGSVYRKVTDEHPSGVGHAEEVRGSGPVNKTSALENCETSAWGRALAAAGLEVRKGIASREEIEQAKAEENRQATTNGNVAEHLAASVDLSIVKGIREKLADSDISADEVGLLLVAVGVEDIALATLLTEEKITRGEAKHAASLLTDEQAQAVLAAVDTRGQP